MHLQLFFSLKFYITFSKSDIILKKLVQNFKIKKIKDTPKNHQLTPQATLTAPAYVRAV